MLSKHVWICLLRKSQVILRNLSLKYKRSFIITRYIFWKPPLLEPSQIHHHPRMKCISFSSPSFHSLLVLNGVICRAQPSSRPLIPLSHKNNVYFSADTNFGQTFFPILFDTIKFISFFLNLFVLFLTFHCKLFANSFGNFDDIWRLSSTFVTLESITRLFNICVFFHKCFQTVCIETTKND